MFSPLFYDKLDPTYRHQLDEVVSALVKKNDKWTTENDDNYFTIFSKFCSNFMTPKELWKDFERYLFKKHIMFGADECLNMEEFLQNIVEISNLPSYHFYYNEFERTAMLNKIMDKNVNVTVNILKNVTAKDLCYPHNKLEDNLHIYEKYAYAALPKENLQIFQKMKNLYKKIKSFDDEDDESWFKAVTEWDDWDFIQQNVEAKLCADLTNKKLWHLYINYLKEHNIEYMLQIYSKYCRFFVDDTIMKEEYQKAAEKYAPISVSWKNTFDFEVFEECKINFQKSEETVSNRDSNKYPLSCFFSSQETKSQIFPFHSNLMNYIVTTANANVLQKLNQSCKYFYHKYRIPICYKLKMSPMLPHTSTIEYNQESVELRRIAPFKTYFPKIYISTVFSFCKTNIFSLSNIIPRIYRCDVKYIYVKNQVITLADFKFLVGHGNVIDLEFDAVKINTSSDVADMNWESALKLEDILFWTPKLQYLRIKDIPYSSQTAQKLCELEFLFKIKHFELSTAQNISLEPNALAEFVKKNMASNGYIKMQYIFDDSPERIRDIREAIENVLTENWEDNKKPIFSFSQRIFQFL